MIRAVRLGEVGFGHFLREIEALRVITREDKLAWLELHAAVLDWSDKPLDHGDGCDGELEALARELGERIE